MHIFSDILSGIYSGILSGIVSDILPDIIFWHLFWLSILPFYLAFILASILAFILAFFLAFYLTIFPAFFLAFYLTFSLWLLDEFRQCSLRSGARGGGPAVPTEIWSNDHWDSSLAVEVRQCPLRSGARSWVPAMPTDINLAVGARQWYRLRSGCAHWDPELAVARGGEGEEEEGGESKESRYAHLAGGKTCNRPVQYRAICAQMNIPPTAILMSTRHCLNSSSKKKYRENWFTSSTAQGGGGSFENRKPTGEVGCCESRMAERNHWWTERRLDLCFLEWLQWLQWSPYHNCWM